MANDIDPASEAAADVEIHHRVKEKLAAGVKDYGEALKIVFRERPGLAAWKNHFLHIGPIPARSGHWGEEAKW